MSYDALMRDEKTGITYRRWLCPLPKASLLLVHGLGASNVRWDFLASFLLQYTISSYAIELQGFGETQGLKGHIDSFDTYFHDIQSLCDIIKRENNGKNIFLVGDSMGGLISFLFAGLRPDLFDGLICISALFKSRLKFNFLEYINIFVSMIFNPKKQVRMPFDAQMCTRDAAYQKVMDMDPREHRLATPKLLRNIIHAQMRVRAVKNKIKVPTLFLIAGDLDALIDPEEVKRVFHGLKTEDKEIIQYPQMYHSLLVELGREKMFHDIVQWVQKRI